MFTCFGTQIAVAHFWKTTYRFMFYFCNLDLYHRIRTIFPICVTMSFLHMRYIQDVWQ